MAPVHAGIKRRHFLRVLGAAAVAIAAAPLAPAPAPQGLAFHKDAFAAVWDIKDYRLGDTVISRFDVLIGWKTIRPEMAVRVLG